MYFFTFSMMKHEDVEEVYVYLMHNGNTVFSMYRWVVFSIIGNIHATMFTQRMANARGPCRTRQSLLWTLSSLRAPDTNIWPDDVTGER